MSDTRKALVAAVHLIRQWHGMGMLPPELEATVWNIYWAQAPEMAPLREVFAFDPTTTTKAPE